MKTVIAVILLLIVFLVFLLALARSQRCADVVNAKSGLLSAYVGVRNGEVLTNSWDVRHHTRSYTNHYVIDAADYQCVVAVDSWDYQGLSNLLVLTTDKKFLYIDSRGAMLVSNMPPGY